jgi:hypothetical protein
LSPGVAQPFTETESENSESSSDESVHNRSFFDVNVSDQSSDSAGESVQELDCDVSGCSDSEVGSDSDELSDQPQATRARQRQGRRRSRGSRIRRTVTSVPHHRQVTKTVPTSANQIEEEDPNHTTPPDFAPIREPGPQLPNMTNPTGLDLFELFFTDEIVQRLVRCTNEYAEKMKHKKGTCT